jgi:anti-sigma B factor antagonist
MQDQRSQQSGVSPDSARFALAGPLASMDVDIAVVGQRARVTLRGELDLAASDVVERAVHDVCGQSCERVVLDVAGLTYCDSSGVRALVNASRECHERGARMIVSGAIGPVQRVFELVHADDLFEMSDTTKPD